MRPARSAICVPVDGVEHDAVAERRSTATRWPLGDRATSEPPAENGGPTGAGRAVSHTWAALRVRTATREPSAERSRRCGVAVDLEAAVVRRPVAASQTTTRPPGWPVTSVPFGLMASASIEPGVTMGSPGGFEVGQPVAVHLAVAGGLDDEAVALRWPAGARGCRARRDGRPARAGRGRRGRRPRSPWRCGTGRWCRRGRRRTRPRSGTRRGSSGLAERICCSVAVDARRGRRRAAGRPRGPAARRPGCRRCRASGRWRAGGRSRRGSWRPRPGRAVAAPSAAAGSATVPATSASTRAVATSGEQAAQAAVWRAAGGRRRRRGRPGWRRGSRARGRLSDRVVASSALERGGQTGAPVAARRARVRPSSHASAAALRWRRRREPLRGRRRSTPAGGATAPGGPRGRPPPSAPGWPGRGRRRASRWLAEDGR